MSHQVNIQRMTLAGDTPGDADFRRWAIAGLSESKFPAEVTIRVVGKRESRKLNRQYRGKNHPTNVLSFPSDLPMDLVRTLADEGANAPLGDLVLCAPVVVAEAAEQKKSAADHWAHMVVHGVLHLQGFDHQVAREAQLMERREIEILSTLGVSDPYQ
ncbi:MAG: rRNA maturation RNase YbeY [Xanthomonadales bacterium]|nr:rRNA maturation RNase YbeY [Gammaproteobacteria bacterium]NNE05081.1 rRNA maturation RNase YbeY [Xanthomonadales bacterium]NNL95911.1 rRNA maturation RNase YbeY [Xanthomonadales bacterium]